MNLTQLADNDLHLATKKSVQIEKTSTIAVIRHLEEINRRKMFVEFGQSTLQKYMMALLGYSEAESWIRIGAMRLIEKAPQAEVMIERNEISLSNAATINTHINDNFTKDPREIERLLKLGKDKPTRKLRTELNPSRKEKKITLNERILKKMEKLLENQSELELIESLLDEKLKLLEISKSTRTQKKPSDTTTRNIPIKTRQEVFQRSGHQCEHIDKSGRRCQEKRNLQYDHPYCMGGDRTSSNIRMLCSGHNQRRAFQMGEGLKMPTVKTR